MKTTEIIGMLSGFFVVVSIIPYSIRVWQKKVHPNITSWSLWSFIGLALLLTYKSSGAQDNIWPAVFGFINPCLVSILVITRKGEFGEISKMEKACFVFGLVSLAVWACVHDNKNLSQYALYIALVADCCAAIPTIVFVWKHPSEDRPFAWALFALAYGFAVFAITEHTFANYILPLYMFFGSFSITLPLTLHRVKNKTPFKEWV